MRRKILVGTVAGVGLALLAVLMGVAVVPTVRQWATYGDLDAHGRANLRAGWEVMDDLRTLNPDLDIVDRGWVAPPGIPEAAFTYPADFVLLEDLRVPPGMERTPVLDHDEPYGGSSIDSVQVTFVESRAWHRKAPRDGREWSCSIRVALIDAKRLAEVVVSCFPA